MKDLTRVIVRPVVTEKTNDMGENDKYAFEVAVDANKNEVKQAVERFFGVKVLDVHTMRMPRKSRRVGKNVGRKPEWKKAIVRLAEGHSIEFFEGV